jgi:uncharacterized protein YndB with AHSA1/START domain
MSDPLIAKSTITIDAPVPVVWGLITNPDAIQKFMLGMQAVTNWKAGSELRWIGRHGERPNDNARGVIEKVDPDRQLCYSFFYPGYGYPDEPQYYNRIIYELVAADGQTTIAVQQADFSVFKDGETMRKHSQEFWDLVLKNLKELAEQQ